MKLCIVVGTRPEVIKMAPVIRELERRQLPFFLIHSNQHYSEMMDKIFFQELSLPRPKYNLNVGSGNHSNQTGNILIKIEPILQEEQPDLVLVQGDTNTVLAAALAAHKLGIKVGHIEAGLRSYDRTMPEESNRVVTDHVSDFLFAVTDKQKEILLSEGIAADKIFVVGNTIVDSVIQNRELARLESKILSTLKISPGEYILFTAHRASNVDSKQALTEVVSLLAAMKQTIVWPIHVRTKKKLEEFGLSLPEHVITCDPLGYLDFLNLEQCAQFIVTDSGGLQEEACILDVPCITIRSNTERPETISVGANRLVGRNIDQLTKALEEPYPEWKNPFGDGHTAENIIDLSEKYVRSLHRNETISMVGLGYMGLPTALFFAKSGYTVNGFDINAEKVKLLNDGVCIFQEDGLKELLHEGLVSKKFAASTELQASDIYIIAVPTPHNNRQCDLSAVITATKSVAAVAKSGALVIIESTIKPRTCRDVVLPIFQEAGIDVDLVHCPERAIPGNTLYEIQNNDRIIGSSSMDAGQRAKTLYSSFVKGTIFLTSLETAEAVKLMENTFRDVNIALANEFANLAEEHGFDVWEAIHLANRHPRVNILQPGPGVGGHCIAIDPWFLAEETRSAKLILAAREINDERPSRVVNQFKKMLGTSSVKKVGVLGVAYKKNIDDHRESPAEELTKILMNSGFEVMAHDPLVKDWHFSIENDLPTLTDWADAFILVTDHDVYKKFQTQKPILDTRNLLSQI